MKWTKGLWENRIRELVGYIMYKAVTGEYEEEILNLIGDDVCEDVLLASGIEGDGCFSETDVKYAIGRVLIDRLSK